MDKYQSINPWNGEILQDWELHPTKQVEQIVSDLHVGHLELRKYSWKKRHAFLMEVQARLGNCRDALAKTITREMGKPLVQSNAEIDKCLALIDHYLKRDEGIRTQSLAFPKTQVRCFTTKESTGVIFAIMPWNFPAWQVIRMAVPQILLGNSVLLKHAPNVSGCASLLESCFRQDNEPAFFKNIRIPVSEAESLISNPFITGVSLTGSRRAGSAVAALAGKYLKPCILELGGNDAFWLLQDAQLSKALPVLKKSRLLNSGQSCIGAKRAFIPVKHRTEVIQWLQEEFLKVRPMDPMEKSCSLGPLAREDLARGLEQQVKEMSASGAMLHGTMKRDRCLFNPLVLEWPDRSQARDEELFGPVLQLFFYHSEQQALDWINSSKYGLGCSIWSSDTNRAMQWGQEISAGMVYINEMVFSDPYLPFGGTKQSGWGRELGPEGGMELLNQKTWYVASP